MRLGRSKLCGEILEHLSHGLHGFLKIGNVGLHGIHGGGLLGRIFTELGNSFINYPVAVMGCLDHRVKNAEGRWNQ